jgi:hypothetical protein
VSRENKEKKKERKTSSAPCDSIHIQESARPPTIHDLPVQGPIHSQTQSPFYDSVTAPLLVMSVSGSLISSSILQ